MARYKNMYFCKKEELLSYNLPPGIVLEVKEQSSSPPWHTNFLIDYPRFQECVYIPISLKGQLSREQTYKTLLRTVVNDNKFILGPGIVQPLSTLYPKMPKRDCSDKEYDIANGIPQLYFNQNIIEPKKQFSRLCFSSEYTTPEAIYSAGLSTVRRMFHAHIEALSLGTTCILRDRRFPVEFVVSTVPSDPYRVEWFDIYVFIRTNNKIQDFDESYGVKMRLTIGDRHVKVDKLGYGIWQEKDDEESVKLLFITDKESIQITVKKTNGSYILANNQAVVLSDVLLANSDI